MRLNLCLQPHLAVHSPTQPHTATDPSRVPAVSLENVLLDVKELGRGMELLRRECGQHESAVLRSFLGGSEGQLERLQRDARTAEVRAAHTRPGANHGTPARPHLALHAPLAHLVIHTLSCVCAQLVIHTLLCTLLMHTCLATPCSACSSYTSGHLHLAFYWSLCTAG